MTLFAHCADFPQKKAAMSEAEHILILLVLTVVGSLLVRAASNRVPLPLVQIVLGVAAALCGLKIGLRPDLFMLVFLPPLLFTDAFRMPLREFSELRGVILFLAFGLVVVSTVLCGYAIHWMLPAIGLAVCFTLAAALSPTDTVAVSSLIAGRRVSERLIHILNGEALFNDASGLVCFHFAMVAAMTGEFSYRHAFGSFVLVSFGGLAIGAGLSWLAVRAERILLRRGFDDPQMQVLMIVLLPFVIYEAAEKVHASGILAAVAGCMVVKLTGVADEAATATRLQAGTVLTTVSYVFNALIFLLLGLQLPWLLDAGVELAHQHSAKIWQLSLLVGEVYAIMLVIRFCGIWVSVLRRWIGARVHRRPFVFPRFLEVVLLSFSGVRGAVTLAAVLSLPAAAANAEAFPGRSFVITVAAGVIVVSLVLAAFAIPFCIHFLPRELADKHAQEENLARQRLLQAVLRLLRDEQNKTEKARTAVVDSGSGDHTDEDIRLEVLGRLAQTYDNRLSQTDGPTQTPIMSRTTALRRERIELAMRLVLLRLQRQTLHDLAEARDINDQTEWEIQRELDYEEQVIRGRVQRLPQDI
ncbi:Na+/H+ antiporter [Brytella acorum]|uniref:Na+/H+ antiporter n=1 Tax=Brytella acorum TaxID=2959299 RepID=A0AA35V525_9PROT|nr:Na+/H+ antiporter [Brytella acorum]MDF3623630.1 Na+/H+ antiporter [Brytella acorum]CAI9119952.1 Na+/H+ antiporter [Brytella acorum]